MDPIFLHLRTNHFPMILIFVGAPAIVLAAFLRKDFLWKYALVTVILAAVSAPIAYWTGLRADGLAGGLEVLDLEAMGKHEESAVQAFVALLAAGVACGIALAKPLPAVRWTAVVVTLAAAALTGKTGHDAGQIAHGDYSTTILDAPK